MARISTQELLLDRKCPDIPAGPMDQASIAAPLGGTDRNVARGISPTLLVLDSSYPFETIQQRNLMDSVTCRDLDGYFSHVWSVHPFATLITTEGWAERCGRPQWFELGERHTFIEGKVGRFKALSGLFALNFLLSQIQLFTTLRRLIRRHRVRAIRVGDPLYLGLFGLLLAWSTGIELVVRVNGNNEKVRQTIGGPLMRRLFRSVAVERAVERFVLRRSDWVMAPNQDNLDFAVASGAAPNRATIVSFGSLLDKRHFIEASARPSADSDLRALGVESGSFLLTIGRLIGPKFPDHVVRVLEFVRSGGAQVKLVLVGMGEMEEELGDLARSLGVGDHVVLAGARDQSWLWRVIPHAAAILSPSTGRALSEVALAGVPIVAYDTDWQADLITDGESGRLVPYRDWPAMGEAAWTILQDPGLARNLGEGARTKALKLLDPTAARDQERAIYDRLLGKLAD